MKHATILSELIIRVVLFITFEITDHAVPFHRIIQPEELWLYRYPFSVDHYPSYLLWITVFSVPALVFIIFYIVQRDPVDLKQASLGVFLSIYLTGCIVNFVKLGVGRPRPDFLARCYPEGPPVQITQFICTGKESDVIQGFKSFPSGHSALSFASLGFTSLYIAGKFHLFNKKRGQGWRLICFLIPLVWATMIAVSRVSDYRHHWQGICLCGLIVLLVLTDMKTYSHCLSADWQHGYVLNVTVGTVMGLVITYTCYRQVYPSLTRVNSHLSYVQIPAVISSGDTHLQDVVSPSSPQPMPQEDFLLISKMV